MEEYLLIPVSLLEGRINLAKREEEICRQSDFELAGNSARTRGIVYEILLSDKSIKRVSLDKNNILSQAEKFADAQTDFILKCRTKPSSIAHLGLYEGYIQAFKSLL